MCNSCGNPENLFCATTPRVAEYRIIRRAYSKHEVVETFVGTWVEAMNHAMKIEAEKRDGEYSVRRPDEPIKSEPSGSYQSPFDWL